MVTTYTIAKKKDGFGSQYQSIMSGIAYCYFMKYEYIHTPFKSIGKLKQEEIDELNNFIGIPSDQLDRKIKITQKMAKVVYREKNPDKYYNKKVLNKIRNYYYSTNKPNIKNIDIAIHIRRGDILNSPLNVKLRYTDNTIYKKIINYLLLNYPNRKITIFSQGELSDFKNLSHKNIIFDLNSSTIHTFHSMVKANILVTAKSSFSYSAALLNKNKIYYLEFWHPPLKKWINIKNIIKN